MRTAEAGANGASSNGAGGDPSDIAAAPAPATSGPIVTDPSEVAVPTRPTRRRAAASPAGSALAVTPVGVPIPVTAVDPPAPAPADGGHQEHVALGIDFGGSGIKGALVNLDDGRLLTERLRLKTPKPATPHACIAVIRELVAEIARTRQFPSDAPVGIGMPAVILEGVAATAVNIDDEWLGFAAQDALADALGRPASVINDADAAGVAEMRFGAGQGHQGTVVLITLGTGVGSALFREGVLVPNTELGHIEVRGKDAELRASAASRERRRLSWAAYAAELDEYLHKLDMLVWPDLIIIGGGISKDADKFIPRLTVRPRVVAAEGRNSAGIVGAAIVAEQRVARRQGARYRAEQG